MKSTTAWVRQVRWTMIRSSAPIGYHVSWFGCLHCVPRETTVQYRFGSGMLGDVLKWSMQCAIVQLGVMKRVWQHVHLDLGQQWLLGCMGLIPPHRRDRATCVLEEIVVFFHQWHKDGRLQWRALSLLAITPNYRAKNGSWPQVSLKLLQERVVVRTVDFLR